MHDQALQADFRDAVHESGHAIVAEALGFRVSEANILKQDGRLGVARHKPPLTTIEDLAIVVAGAVAEGIAGVAEQDPAGFWGDMRDADALLLKVYGRDVVSPVKLTGDPASDRRRLRMAALEAKRELPCPIAELPIWRKACRLAHNLLNQHWPAVMDVAGQLVIHKKLTGADVRAAVVRQAERRRERQRAVACAAQLGSGSANC